MKQFKFDDAVMLDFRALRLWHWRKVLKNLDDVKRHKRNSSETNAERSKGKANFHLKHVESLNRMFNVDGGDTASHDEYLSRLKP